MNTEIVKISYSDNEYSEKIKDAADIIKNGGLVVFPTETVYGLGADATNPDATKNIYSAKGRPSDNPLIVHISKPEDAESYTYTNSIYYKIARAFMPGPITVVLKAKPTIPESTRGGLDTVAIRCPENQIARDLIFESGVPIAAPSANLSGSPSPTVAKHVIDDMLGRVDMIIDGGEAEFGLESTIVKIDDDGSVTLLRPGKITVEDLLTVVTRVNIADAVTDKLADGEKAISPGMKYRHYAPSTPLFLLDSGEAEKIIEYIKNDSLKRIAVIVYEEELSRFKEELPNAVCYPFGKKDDELTQAHILFSLLREVDEGNFDKIYAPLPKKSGIGLALYNRMIRAAAHTVIKL